MKGVCHPVRALAALYLQLGVRVAALKGTCCHHGDEVGLSFSRVGAGASVGAGPKGMTGFPCPVLASEAQCLQN